MKPVLVLLPVLGLTWLVGMLVHLGPAWAYAAVGLNSFQVPPGLGRLGLGSDTGTLSGGGGGAWEQNLKSKSRPSGDGVAPLTAEEAEAQKGDHEDPWCPDTQGAAEAPASGRCGATRPGVQDTGALSPWGLWVAS